MSQTGVETVQVLMIVKTYPTPSTKYGELVCTAGIRLDTHQWVRIYPYPFRLIEQDYQFTKYDIIELPLERATGDPRVESYKLHDIDKIVKVGHVPSQDSQWTERMRHVRPSALNSVRGLMDGMFPVQGWGPSILPVAVRSDSATLLAEPQSEEWPADDFAKLQQAKVRLETDLFATGDLATRFRELRRPPFKFRLRYTDLAGVEYTHLLLDWEIAQLFFKMRQKHGTDAMALEKVKHKIEREIFAPDREVFLVLGNIHHRFRDPEKIAVDGFIWPRRSTQLSLFEDSGV